MLLGVHTKAVGVHHATVVTTAGDSYRLKAATRTQTSRAPQEGPRP